MATTTDGTDAAAAAGVATPITSLDEYNQVVADQATKPGFAVTADHTDLDVGWTVQSTWSAPDPQNLPGQVFTPEQLPDPRIAARAGFPAVIIPEHLVTTEEDHPQGPEPWETGRDPRDVRDAIRERTVSDLAEQKKTLDDAKAADAVAEAPAKKTAVKASTATI